MMTSLELFFLCLLYEKRRNLNNVDGSPVDSPCVPRRVSVCSKMCLYITSYIGGYGSSCALSRREVGVALGPGGQLVFVEVVR